MPHEPGNGDGPIAPTTDPSGPTEPTTDPTEPTGPTIDPTEPTVIVKPLTIFINARSVLWEKPTISFQQVVEQWNKLDPERHVIGDLPSINWTEKDGAKGILYPTDGPIDAVDELAFKIDDSYLA